MQADKKNLSSFPTRILYIPQLPLLLLNWNLLKTHFSQYGFVQSVVLNPQTRSCTVSFKTIADAENAKSKGCVWKNKAFDALYYSDGNVNLDPRAKVEALGYSELDTLWSDEDMDEFSVPKTKSPFGKLKSEVKVEHNTRKVKTKLASDVVMKEGEFGNIRVSKVKSSENEKRSAKSIKLKANIDKKSVVSSERKESMEKQREAKKKLKEAVSELNKRRKLKIPKKMEADLLTKSLDNPSLRLKEKFKLLEERDKLIRKNIVKSPNVKLAKAIVGTCPDMCPEKERIMREFRRLVSIYEMTPGTQEMDHAIAVKAYVRSSADQEEPLPHELRPEPVLSMTMSYLITKIMPLIYDPDVNIAELYDFCWDRLRGIRKDVIQQRLCSLETVTIIEQCARFHICCYDLFWGADLSIFDEKINTENLMNCLQTLRHMYEDLAKEEVKCPNEAEFNAYMILLNMKTGDLMATYQSFTENLKKEERIQATVKIYLTFNNYMYSQFFKLVKGSTYLDACLLQRYFYNVRVHALQVIARAYCPPNKGGTIPLKQMKNILKFDSGEDTKLFCEGHGIMLKENRRDFSLYRNDFLFPETKINNPVPSSLVTNKRLPLIEAVTGGRQYNLRTFRNHKVHSSFTVDGTLTQLASDASDQKGKSTEMFNISVDSEMADITDGDEEITEGSTSFYQSEESFNNQGDCLVQYEENKEDFSVPMDTDNINILPKTDARFSSETKKYSESVFSSKQDESVNDKYDNNDSVSRKHLFDSSNVRFDLSAKIEPVQKSVPQPQQISTSFNFGTAGASLFGTKNQLISDQMKQNQFALNINFTSRSFEDNRQIDGKDYINYNKTASTVETTFENSKQHSIFGKSKENFNKIPVGSSGFTFSLEQKDNASLLDKNNMTDFRKSPSKSDSCSEVKEAGIEHKTSDSFATQRISDIFTGPTERSEIDRERSAVEIKTVEEKEKYAKKVEREAAMSNEIKRRLHVKTQMFMKLKRDLRQRLKQMTARHYARKWKQKIDKIKQNRKDFPLLMGIPIDQHETVWGMSVNMKSLFSRSLLNRLKDKQHSLENVNLILNDGLCSTVKYQGKQIAENISLNNRLRLDLRDFNVPFCYKLVVSIPFSEDSFFYKKFHQWLSKLFYESDNADLGSVTEEMTLQNVSVYYCVHLVAGNCFQNVKDKLNGMRGLIFFNVSDVESSSDKCKRFRNLIASNKGIKPVTVGFVNIGKEGGDINKLLINVINDKMKRFKVDKWTEEYWKDFESITRIVKFVTSDVDLSNSIRVNVLTSLFIRVSEHTLNLIDSAKIVSSEFSCALNNPNFVIDCYNLLFKELQNIVIDNNLKDYDIVPPEFKSLVRHVDKLGKVSSLDVSFSKTRRPNIVKSFSRLELPHIKPWPPQDASELFDILHSYCVSVNCENILPRLIRMINLDDDINVSENLLMVSWGSIIDLIVRQVLEMDVLKNSACVIVYDENSISNLFKLHFGFTLLYDKLITLLT